MAVRQIQPHEFSKWRRTIPPSPRRRVALLGIAQRQIRLQFSHKLRKPQHANPLVDSIKTLGDWIRFKCQEKNLTPGHLAAKMGIASDLVCSWEEGTRQPGKQQLELLTNFLNHPANGF
jgi:DNA-binding transcriptional regulator YiaG